tara:strand:- start:2727 stop:3545 length:819 start_codon:yes stop_codon:yes gene_type:complete
MFKNYRVEVSFKDFDQLKKKLDFCLNNKIYKINIPCKGKIKKDFLLEVVKFIGLNYMNLDVIYHYSFYHQFYNNKDLSYQKFLNFVEVNKIYNKSNEILLVSGSQKRNKFEILDILEKLKFDLSKKVKFGVAFNPYSFEDSDYKIERNRLIDKLNSYFVHSIWLQFGSDVNQLAREINFLKKIIGDFEKLIDREIKIYGSLFIPSKQFLARFKFRPWRGVYLSNKYLNSLEESTKITREIIDFYFNNSIIPLVETELSTEKQFIEAQNFIDL